MADATLESDGQQINATVRAWYRQFTPGQQIDVLYLPSDPTDLRLDSFWQSYCRSVAGMVVLGIIIVKEGAQFVTSSVRESGRELS